MLSSKSDPLIKHISVLEQKRYQYLLTKRYDEFTLLCHPDLRYIHTSGKVDDFLGYTGKCQAGFYQYSVADLVVERVEIFDTVALVFGELKSEFLAGTDSKKLHNKILSVWVKFGGDWKFYAYQPTAIF